MGGAKRGQKDADIIYGSSPRQIWRCFSSKSPNSENIRFEKLTEIWVKSPTMMAVQASCIVRVTNTMWWGPFLGLNDFLHRPEFLKANYVFEKKSQSNCDCMTLTAG